MVDDFAGYRALFASGTTELGCWAHARRKFVDLHHASGSPIANEAIQRIAALYRIEADARDLDPDARRRWRQQHALPKIEEVDRWLTALRPQVLDAGGTLTAIDYTLKRWAALTHYLDVGRFPIDNNPIENAIRPIAIGRKNWLFAASDTAGRRAAAIMSLLATAKANGQDSHAWVTDVLSRLPTRDPTFTGSEPVQTSARWEKECPFDLIPDEPDGARAPRTSQYCSIENFGHDPLNAQFVHHVAPYQIDDLDRTAIRCATGA